MDQEVQMFFDSDMVANFIVGLCNISPGVFYRGSMFCSDMETC